MRVLFVSNLFPPGVLGGYEILCGQVASALADRGHDVHVLTTPAPDGTGFDETWKGRVAVYPDLELLAPFAVAATWGRTHRALVTRRNRHRTAATIARVRPDVVFVWSQLRLTIGPLRAVEASGIPLCHTINDDHLVGYAQREFAWCPRAIAGFLLDRTVYRNATLSGLRLENTACISSYLSTRLRQANVPLADPVVEYQGIPIERFPQKTDLNRVSTPFRVLYAGQLLKQKGVHTVIEAVGRVRERFGGDGVSLTVAGDGPDRAALEAQAAEMCPDTQFLGRLDQASLAALYRESDVLVFASGREAFGLTHLEAMASGTAVVSTTDGGHAEFLRDGENCLTFPFGDAEGLSGALNRLRVLPAYRRRLAAEARADVERHFTLTGYVDRLEQWLARTAARVAA